MFSYRSRGHGGALYSVCLITVSHFYATISHKQSAAAAAAAEQSSACSPVSCAQRDPTCVSRLKMPGVIERNLPRASATVLLVPAAKVLEAVAIRRARKPRHQVRVRRRSIYTMYYCMWLPFEKSMPLSLLILIRNKFWGKTSGSGYTINDQQKNSYKDLE